MFIQCLGYSFLQRWIAFFEDGPSNVKCWPSFQCQWIRKKIAQSRLYYGNWLLVFSQIFPFCKWSKGTVPYSRPLKEKYWSSNKRNESGSRADWVQKMPWRFLSKFLGIGGPDFQLGRAPKNPGPRQRDMGSIRSHGRPCWSLSRLGALKSVLVCGVNSIISGVRISPRLRWLRRKLRTGTVFGFWIDLKYRKCKDTLNLLVN